jgi:cytochrome c peroxidase
MHDGTVATLSEVITIFENGGQGAGKNHPHKSIRLKGFRLSPNERRDLLAFLYEL